MVNLPLSATTHRADGYCFRQNPGAASWCLWPVEEHAAIVTARTIAPPKLRPENLPLPSIQQD